jgi:predicted nucleic-acid-binding protein
MIAVDTDVLVRLLTDDNRQQAAAARALVETEAVWIAKTVFLETEWVLRTVYEFDEGAIREAFTRLLGLRNVHVEDEPTVAAALALTAQGIEFADALHLASRPRGASFVSFDRSFVRRATRAGARSVFIAPPRAGSRE